MLRTRLVVRRTLKSSIGRLLHRSVSHHLVAISTVAVAAIAPVGISMFRRESFRTSSLEDLGHFPIRVFVADLLARVRSPPHACTIVTGCVQTKGGQHPSGFVAHEFQEWMRFRVLPAIRRLARKHFVKGRNKWFKKKIYDELCRAVGHEATGMAPMFLISQDSDPRHTMADHAGHSGRLRRGQTPPDRRLLEKGQKGYIDVDPIKNYMPHAAKVPDSVQVAVESFFGAAKPDFKRRITSGQCATVPEMVHAISAALERAATVEKIHNHFVHGEVCMRVFAGTTDEVVEHNGVVYHCTHGKWLPRGLAA